MPSPTEDRSRVVAVIHALKVDGIRVKNWKNYLNGASPTNDHLRKESQYKFAFGRDLALLPSCHVEDAGGPVSKFLVDACEFLSLHLHTEGLFRKTGSLTRIRSLRAGLEQGHPVFSPPYLATLQPCDVASLLKQFLRELPSPLIPLDLQGPLCLAQCLEEEEGEGEGSRERKRDDATLLLTALLPPPHTRFLRYFCSFLRRAAARCEENRMEVGNLALMIAPNLLQCPAGGSKLTASTERQLNKQAAVVKALITNAERIGTIPSSLMSMSPVAEGGESLAPPDDGRFQERGRLGVYRSLRRPRRRSVGEIFVDALSKLKTGLIPTGPSNPTDSHQGHRSPPLQSPAGAAKRKSTDPPVPEAQGSAKKRRSLQDLRDSQPRSQGSEDAEASVGQSRSTLPVLSGVEGSREKEAGVTLNAAEKKRSQQIYNRFPAEEDSAQRRRTLRLFNMAGAVLGGDPEDWTMKSGEGPSDAAGEAPVSHHLTRVPTIVVEGPGRAVRESGADDDPDLLNYSFTDSSPSWSPPAPPGPQPGSPAPPDPPAGSRTVRRQFERSFAVFGGGSSDGSEGQDDPSPERGGQAQTEAQRPAKEAGPAEEAEPDEEVEPEESQCRAKGSSWVSLKPRRPRRSLSMPEVTLTHTSCHDDDPQGAGDRSLSITPDNDAPEEAWPAWAGLGKRRPRRGGTVTAGGVRGAGGNDRRDDPKKQEKKEKLAGLKRGTSVAERLRRFNTLAQLLRPPRVPSPPPPPGPLLLPDVLRHALLAEGGACGTGRLRRQGARRFGRSISHNGVPEGESGGRRRHGEEGAELEGVQAPAEDVPQAAPVPAPQRSQGRRGEGRRGHWRLAEHVATEIDLPELLHVRLNLRGSGPEEEGVARWEEGRGMAEAEPLDRQTRQIRALVRQDAQVTEAPRPPPAPLATPPPPAQLTTPPPPSQLATPPPPSQPATPLHAQSCSLTLSTATQTDRTTPLDYALTTPPDALGFPERVSALDFRAGDVDGCPLPADGCPSPADGCPLPADRCPRPADGCPLPVDTSPTALQFRSRATRRHYRDSPRWLIHKMSMTSGDPVHI